MNIELDIDLTPVFMPELLQQNGASDGEDEQPLLVEVLIFNEEQSFSTVLTGSQWIKLIREYGISRSGILAFLRNRERSREERAEMEQVLTQVLARQDEGIAFSDDDEFVRKLLDELAIPQSVEFQVLEAMPPGILLYGKKKKGKGGSGAHGGGKGQGVKKAPSRGKPGNGREDAAHREGAAEGGQLPSGNGKDQSLLGEGADLNVAAIIVRSRLNNMMSHDSILLGLYGAGLLDWEQFNRLSQMQDKSDCSHQVMDIARSLVELGEKLDFLRVVYQAAKREVDNPSKELMKKVPTKYQSAVETVPQVVLVELDNAEEMAALMSRVAAMSFFESRNLADFQRLLRGKWPDIFTSTEGDLSGREVLEVCLGSYSCGFRYLYVEKKLLEKVSVYLSPELRAYVEANGLDDLKDRHPPVQLYIHSIGMSTGFSLVMKSPFRMFSKEQAQRLESAVKQALAASNGRSMSLPGELVSELELSDIKIVKTDTLGKKVEPPPGMEAFQSIYEAVIQSDSVRQAHELTQSIINGEPLTISPEISSEVYLVAMLDYVQAIEDGHLMSSEQSSIVKEYLHNLKDLFQGVVPDSLNPIPVVANMMGVIMMEGEEGAMLFGTVDEGVRHTINFFRLSIDFLHHRVGLYQIFTSGFARELSQCLEPLGCL